MLAPQPTSLTSASRSLPSRRRYKLGKRHREEREALREMPNELTYRARGKTSLSIANDHRVSSAGERWGGYDGHISIFLLFVP